MLYSINLDEEKSLKKKTLSNPHGQWELPPNKEASYDGQRVEESTYIYRFMKNGQECNYVCIYIFPTLLLSKHACSVQVPHLNLHLHHTRIQKITFKSLKFQYFYETIIKSEKFILIDCIIWSNNKRRGELKKIR